MIHGVLLIAGTLAGTGLIAGGVVALIVVLFASNNRELAVQIVTYSYYLLSGLFPIALWVAVYTSHDEEAKAAYRTLWRAILTTLQGAVVGSILGGGPFFLAALTYPVVIVTDNSITEFGPLMRDLIVWSLLSITVIATVLAALPIGTWAYYSKTGWGDD